MTKNSAKLSTLVTMMALSTNAFSMIGGISPKDYHQLNYNLKKLELSSKKATAKTNAKGTIIEGFALNGEPQNWFNLSPALDSVEGVGSDQVYSTLGDPLSQDIIVAVIDSGVDVNHEDLQGKIWINTNEIPNNGIDDDKNGYTDDVFGWNFIGGKDGMAKIEEDASLENGMRLIKGNPSAQTDADSLEMTREYARLLALSETRDLTAEEKAIFNEVKSEVLPERRNALNGYTTYSELKNKYIKAEEVLKASGVSEMTYQVVKDFKAKTPEEELAKKMMLDLLQRGYTLNSINESVAYFDSQANFLYNPDLTAREEIVGDNYADQNEKYYGNSDVIGPDSSHGTHVAGIIAAKRDNGIGINGVAKNVKIMAVRVVPNGDERDKDVANGIRYAVDNGAKVINMSFGKAYSPYKSVVDAAVKYAESKGVLLVHAAGNSYANNDEGKNFPNRKMLSNGKEATNWLEIGASSYKKGSSLAAAFSNYGKNTVDIFAPGVNLLSTTPDNNYDSYSGTSMASPAAAGVAALILSYRPDLKAQSVRKSIIETARVYPELKVYKSRLGEVFFSELSITGGLVDGLKAVEYAKTLPSENTPGKGERRGFFRRLFGRN